MNQTNYIPGTGWRRVVKPSMLRRMEHHDYQSRCIYMLTLTLADRSRPLLGELRWQGGVRRSLAASPSSALSPSKDGLSVSLSASPSSALFVPSPLGILVEKEWKNLSISYPQVDILSLQLMPEHLHVLIFARQRLPKPLGKLVGAVKNRCNHHYWNLLTAQGLLGPKGTVTPPPLFSAGFQDSILIGDGQLEIMKRYVAQNPFRALVKRDRPDLFRVVSSISVASRSFAAIGNRWLLDRPMRLQVRCHNNDSEMNRQLIAYQKEYFLKRGQQGAVIVSPCISRGEVEIARAVLDAGLPLIVILENGFRPFYKPPGKYFEACAKGLLLMLAPWPYHTDRRTITRSQCLALNEMAADISTEPWTEEQERGMMK